MRLCSMTVENVRSFLKREELKLDGSISLLVGPNGGGKTNLLDIAVIMLRRYMFASVYPVHAPTAEQFDRYELRHNDALNSMTLEPHSNGIGKPQIVEVEIEVTKRDLENMRVMQDQAAELTARAQKKYINLEIQRAANWNLGMLSAGTRLVYRWEQNVLKPSTQPATEFREYMNNFEIDSLLRSEFELSPLSMPMLYLPVARTMNGLQSTVELAGYNDYEQKRHNDASMSRSNSPIANLAIGRLALKFRKLQEDNNVSARTAFKADPNLVELTIALKELGYDWELETIDWRKNTYDVRLKKQGSSFLVGAASSGERELLTYLFAIFALNVRDALIVVDEPELHLHPNWQRRVFQIFAKLAASTGNQFLLATHSPTFISPQSIQFVSRVFSREQQSHILRLATAKLPDARHLLQIVNSQNNEGIFFADEVILVEGLSDRIFFEAILDKFGRQNPHRATVEIISVGGKGLFAAYSDLLRACQVPYSIIADRDYIEQIGPADIKGLFKLDKTEIKKDVIDNDKSKDGQALFDRIEEAMKSGSWTDAQETWEYIKSRRLTVKADLSGPDEKMLTDFIVSKRADRVYVLQKGAIEAYLPEGHRSKDIDKLIRFIAEDDFWSKLAPDAQKELKEIAMHIMPVEAEPTTPTKDAVQQAVAASSGN
jgi:putative ATP-dependent endonuclease of OLD family